jgi:hypothetical protein
MRIAILFFGEIRNNITVWKNIYETLVVPNNADVFMHHIYYEKDFYKNFSEKEQKFFEMFYLEDKKEVHYTPPKELFEVFKPKKILLEPHREYPCEELPEIMKKINPKVDNLENTYEQVRLNYFTIRSQAESRKKVLELKNIYEQEYGFEYDAVIMTRLDISITEPVYIQTPLQCVVANVYFHANNCPPGCVEQIREQLIIGNSKMMNEIGSFYEAAPALYLELCNYDSHFKQNEHFLAQHLYRKGIPIMNYPFPLTYYDPSKNPNGLVRSTKAFAE